jgi:hypothetical protein
VVIERRRGRREEGRRAIMKNRKTDRKQAHRGRLTVLVAIGVVVVGLGIGGVGAVLAKGSRSTDIPSAPTRTPAASQSPETPDDQLSDPSPSETPMPEPSSTPAPDPNALADGVYPTFVRGVDVQGATVTVDVLQTFFGEAALTAAREDDVAVGDVIYDPVYIRNENPLLRTLPVSRDVRVEFIGGCESPNRWVGLTQLRKDTTPYTESFYYEVTVVDGTVVLITQKIAISAC